MTQASHEVDASWGFSGRFSAGLGGTEGPKAEGVQLPKGVVKPESPVVKLEWALPEIGLVDVTGLQSEPSSPMRLCPSYPAVKPPSTR